MFGALGKFVAGKKVTTYLKVNNQTSQQIRVDVPGGDDHDWYEPHRPNINFRNVTVSAYDYVEKQEDINATASGNMVTMYIEFENGKSTSVRFDQGKAAESSGNLKVLEAVVDGAGAAVGGAVGGAMFGAGAVPGAVVGGIVGGQALHATRYTPDERMTAQVSSVQIECQVKGGRTMEVKLTEIKKN